jgi:hypothetical protein
MSAGRGCDEGLKAGDLCRNTPFARPILGPFRCTFHAPRKPRAAILTPVRGTVCAAMDGQWHGV